MVGALCMHHVDVDGKRLHSDLAFDKYEVEVGPTTF